MTVDSDIKAIIKQEFAKFHKEMKEELTKFNMEIMQALIESKFKDTEKEKGADGVGSIIDPSQESKPKKITKAEAKVTAKTEARVKAEARAIRFEALAKAEDSAAAEARIKASKAKASAFASFLKAERERHKSSPKVIKATIKDINVKSKGDSTPVNHQGVMSRKMVVDSTEFCSEGDGISVTNLVVIPNKEVDSKVALPVLGDNTSIRVFPCAVENAGKNGKIAAATNLPFSPVICMDMASIEPKFVTPYNDYDLISSQEKFRFGPTIKMGVKDTPIKKASSVYLDHLLSFAFQEFGVNLAPYLYLKFCMLLFLARPLAFKGGG